MQATSQTLSHDQTTQHKITALSMKLGLKFCSHLGSHFGCKNPISYSLQWDKKPGFSGLVLTLSMLSLNIRSNDLLKNQTI